MSSLTVYSAKKLLELLVGKTGFTTPTAYLALCTSAPDDDTPGTAANYTGYARVATAGSDWAAALDDKTITNAEDIEFPICTAGSSTITHFEIWDASSGGNRLLFGALTGGSLAVSANIVPRFAAGTLVGSAA